MLSIGKLAPGRHDYYLGKVAAGAEEYYLGAGEAPGRWVGRASPQLGLDGKVSAHDLAAVLDARHPDGYRLIGNQGQPRVSGFDCTFCAPKSVSLLFALAPIEIRREVRHAHDAAIDAALAVLETEASRARRGRGGATQVEADGFVASAFRHRTSRAGDPHLHTHVLVANLAHVGSEDRWTALDARPIYGWAKTTGYLYEVQLRVELTRRLGVTWNQPERGIADVAGIAKPVLRHFSQRRQQIEAHLKASGRSGGRAAQVATYVTRASKDPATSYADLSEDWQERAARLDVDERTLAGLCSGTARHEVIAPDSRAAEALYERLALPSGVTAQRSTFNRRDVIQHLCDLLPAGADTHEVLALADAFLASPRHVVVLTTGASDRIRMAGGATAPIPTDARRYTTPEMLRTEAHLLQMAGHRRDAGVGIASADAVEQSVATRPTLTDEQQAMVRRVCRSGDGVDVVEGVAGAGKDLRARRRQRCLDRGGPSCRRCRARRPGRPPA